MKPLVCLNWNRLASRNEFSIVGRKSFCLPGFTLVELLVTIAAGAFLMAGAASLITSQIRSNIVSELAQRVRDDANRLNFLLQTEAGEAISITRSGSIPNNCGESGTTAFQFGS
ncbi:prepilin-type N-terminal cleavage/methylation domain-containing protein [Synechococcus sp. CBW1002]|uniref:PulJ/GspJ family protein n=1 Tax=Synechococcus sp. CBW1002 TaxID=1353134 RepID=UPI0018CC9900|nr:prepilin-type N-terminal cleavage/methylation domain-containing protein [Synechococcus sp. CBW1002]QPN58969.1 prepilin-type N-terminal cleavage/methylation domain-containing protein [Synechococcus sp. CBW1002]